MAKNSEKTYWPHMILGFLIVGISLSYWTVMSASSMPVQESNEYMMKYQQADININDIIIKKRAFDKMYTISIEGIETMVMTDNIHSNVSQPDPIKLKKGKNSFTYRISSKNNSLPSDVNVTFLLTRPHSTREDKYIIDVPLKDGLSIIEDINIEKAGRYTLQLRVKIGEKVGYSQLGAYLKLP